MNLNEYKGVFVFIEQRDGELQKVSLELLGKGRELADQLNTSLIGVLLGFQVSALANEVIYYGADEVVIAEHEQLKLYTTEAYTKIITEILLERKPEIMLIGATALGRDLAPRISARIHTGLTADCTSLDIEEGTNNLLMTRPAFGGNIMATIICPEHRPQMSTVRPGVMIKRDRDQDRKGKITTFAPRLTKEDFNVEILEVVKEGRHKKKIEEANILVSGGRGVGRPEAFEALQELADVLGGMVSGSRGAVDAGWIDRSYQVGQTGKTVRPDLYFACGISGAIQHIAGMEESEIIVAINKSPDAPIFELADVGIVGDIHKVIPALVERLKEAKKD